jgi:hypothetical protein
MSLDAKVEYQRKKHEEKFAQKANEIKEAMMTQLSCEVKQLRSKLDDPATLAKRQAVMRSQSLRSSVCAPHAWCARPLICHVLSAVTLSVSCSDLCAPVGSR